jgi:secondary thiamine-phosphate synthase enzyme
MVDYTILDFETRGRGTLNITEQVERFVDDSGIHTGICTLFLQHTSASLMITENADPAVQKDLETVLARVAPDGDPAYIHDTEGPDDMASHARSVLTSNSFTIPVADGRLMLGIWQGLFLWEHRTSPQSRSAVIMVVGEE